MNLFTALAWLSYFQSLRLLEPAIANVLHAGVGPLTILGMGAVGWRIVDAGRMTALEAACQAAMGICLAGLVAVALLGLSAGAGGVTALIGCLFVTASGAAITIATLYAKRLHDQGASAAAVVATRFLGVLAAAARRACHSAPPRRAMRPPRPPRGWRCFPRRSCSWRCRSTSTRSA